MFVAVCDQPFGTSTFSWRKIVLPFSLPISATRRSHSTASNGETLPSVNFRWNSRPVRTSTSAVVAGFDWSVFSFIAIFVNAIFASAQVGSPAQREPLYFTPEWAGRSQVPDSQQAAAGFDWMSQEFRNINRKQPPLAHPVALLERLRFLRYATPAALGAPTIESGRVPPRCSD